MVCFRELMQLNNIFRELQFMTSTADTTILPSIEIEPTTKAERSIIWLHGLGANGHDFVPIVNELKLPESLKIRFIFPHAPELPITINNGHVMPAWYDVLSLTSADRADEAGMRRSMIAIRQLIERETSRGVSPDHIILAGFSQGAAMALSVGLQHDKPLAGIMALSGYLPKAAQSGWPTAPTSSIFIGHGLEDNIVPYALGKAAYLALNEAGYNVDWHSYSMGHAVCGEEIRDISAWIRSVFG